MHVRHFESDKDQADPGRLEYFHLRPADRLSGADQVSKQVRFEIEPVVDLDPRYDQGVSRPKRTVGKKSDGLVILPHEIGRQLARDYAGENTGHSISLKSLT